jgi:hypothetical protein
MTGERLVGYIGLIRTGDSAWYNAIMGHGDHLRHGVMYLLHYELVGRMLAERPPGLRYLVFYQFKRRDADSLTWWKTLALFKPHYVACTDEYNLKVPSSLPMPSVPEALVLLKQTTGLPQQDAIALCTLYGIDAAWMTFLQRLTQIEAARAPGLLARVLSHDRYPPREVLRQLVSSLFPLECLEGIKCVVVLLQGKARGLDTLMPIFDTGMSSVAVFHGDETELQALRETYPSDWQYLPGDDAGYTTLAAHVAKSDLLIAEMPVTRSTEYLRTAIAPLNARRLLLSVDEALLVILGCDDLSRDKVARRLSWLLGAAYDCREVSFRHGDPTSVYWVWLEARQ